MNMARKIHNVRKRSRNESFLMTDIKVLLESRLKVKIRMD
jgi:hypothetical protein